MMSQRSCRATGVSIVACQGATVDLSQREELTESKSETSSALDVRMSDCRLSVCNKNIITVQRQLLNRESVCVEDVVRDFALQAQGMSSISIFEALFVAPREWRCCACLHNVWLRDRCGVSACVAEVATKNCTTRNRRLIKECQIVKCQVSACMQIRN